MRRKRGARACGLPAAEPRLSHVMSLTTGELDTPVPAVQDGNQGTEWSKCTTSSVAGPFSFWSVLQSFHYAENYTQVRYAEKYTRKQ